MNGESIMHVPRRRQSRSRRDSGDFAARLPAADWMWTTGLLAYTCGDGDPPGAGGRSLQRTRLRCTCCNAVEWRALRAVWCPYGQRGGWREIDLWNSSSFTSRCQPPDLMKRGSTVYPWVIHVREKHSQYDASRLSETPLESHGTKRVPFLSTVANDKNVGLRPLPRVMPLSFPLSARYRATVLGSSPFPQCWSICCVIAHSNYKCLW